EHRAVRAVLAREAGARGAVEARAVEVAFARVLLRGREVDEARALVHLQQAGESREGRARVHHPVARGHGPAGSREIADLDVGEALVLGEPEEALAVLQ